jgi:hypothetical protein
MNDDEMVTRIRDVLDSGDMEAVAKAQYEMASEDMVLEYPQSGERFRGRDAIAEMNSQYQSATGTAPRMKVRRVLKPGESFVVEGTIDYGDGVPVSVISVFEMGPDRKIVRETDYFANPFEAPTWRRQYADQMEPVPAM